MGERRSAFERVGERPRLRTNAYEEAIHLNSLESMSKE
jgi:hypothetical protein